MNQVSCKCDPNLDQPNHSNAKQTVIDTFSFKDISEYDIALIFVSDEFSFNFLNLFDVINL